MADRNRLLVAGELLAGALSGWLLFRWVPTRRRAQWGVSDRTVPAAMYGMLVALVAPMLLGSLLPAPATWFPHVVIEYSDDKIQRELDFLMTMAQRIDQERK
jgi:hypothetical protein